MKNPIQMKNQILLIALLLFSLSSTAQISATLVGDACNSYTLSFDGTSQNLVPPYYSPLPPPPPLPGAVSQGYSYFWYTSDGQTSCDQYPVFSFIHPNVTISIVITPRKKGGLDKVYISQNIPVDQSTCPKPQNANLQPWVDHQPRVGDSIYLTIPLQRCHIGLPTIGSIEYNPVTLQGPRVLPLTDLSHSVDDSPNQVDFSYEWHDNEYFTQIVIAFKVMALHDSTINCVINTGTTAEDMNCNKQMIFSEIAKGGPYDPNLLEPSLGTNLVNCNIGDSVITYNLQFQNEGDGPTESGVCVLIKLDPKLDPSSFYFINANTRDSSSCMTKSFDSDKYPYFNDSSLATYSFRLENVFGLAFPYMKLSSKTLDLYGSIGYISFTARVRSGVQLLPGDSLVTVSEVIFSPEVAVQTNRAITTCAIVSASRIKVPPIHTESDSCCCEKCSHDDSFIKYWWIVICILFVFGVYLFLRKRK